MPHLLMAMPEPGSVAHHALTGTLAVREDGPEPHHVLAGYTVPPGMLLEVRLAPTASEPTREEPDWLPVRYEARSPVGPWATWRLAIDTPAGPREVDLRLPPDAVLRWPPQAAVIAVGEADYARLAELPDLLERSYAALDRVHEDPRSGIPQLAWRLFRFESASSVGLARMPRMWAEQRRWLSTQDLTYWRSWPRTWSRPWRCSVGWGAAAPRARAVIQDESGQLLLEAGWLRDVCRRPGQPGPR